MSTDFKLKFEFIELDNLLKVLELAASGSEAKQIIQSGEVKVNGQVENRIRCKLRSGDSVEFRQQLIRITTA
jgi:ribosome-associated protein